MSVLWFTLSLIRNSRHCPLRRLESFVHWTLGRQSSLRQTRSSLAGTRTGRLLRTFSYHTLCSLGTYTVLRFFITFSLSHTLSVTVLSVLWRCCLGGRKGIRPVKKTEWWGAGLVIYLSLASLKSRLVIPFGYRLTWVVSEKGPLNGCVCVSVCLTTRYRDSVSDTKLYDGFRISWMGMMV